MRLIESLELGPGDFVFLLDENEIPDQDRSRRFDDSLSGIGLVESADELKDSLVL